MPGLIAQLEKPKPLRFMFYGAAKTRKTLLAGSAAEAGYNVIFLASEPGTDILSNLSLEAQKRIFVIDIQDEGKEAKAAEFMTFFCRDEPFYWNEGTKKLKYSAKEPDDIYIDWANLDSNTFVIADSYSAIVNSLILRYAIENNVDLSDAKRQDWDGYNYCGMLATWMIRQLVKLPCHFILIGHQQMYEKRSKDGKEVEWQRMQMKSTSGPHSMTIAQEFDEVVWFTLKGQNTFCDLRPAPDRDGGGRILSPKEYKFADMQIANIYHLKNIPLPPADLKPVSDLFARAEAGLAAPKMGANLAAKKGAKTSISTGLKSGALNKLNLGKKPNAS